MEGQSGLLKYTCIPPTAGLPILEVERRECFSVLMIVRRFWSMRKRCLKDRALLQS